MRVCVNNVFVCETTEILEKVAFKKQKKQTWMRFAVKQLLCRHRRSTAWKIGTGGAFSYYDNISHNVRQHKDKKKTLPGVQLTA